MVWVYVGDGEPSPFPELSFNQVPFGSHVLPVMAKFKCNWVQLMETLWDPAHVMILHGSGDTMVKAFDGADVPAAKGEGLSESNGSPLALGDCDVAETDFGFMYRFGTTAHGKEGGWVPTVMPCWLFIGPTGAARRMVTASCSAMCRSTTRTRSFGRSRTTRTSRWAWSARRS